MKKILTSLFLVITINILTPKIHPLTETEALSNSIACGTGIGATIYGICYYIQEGNLSPNQKIYLAAFGGFAGLWLYLNEFWQKTPSARFLEASNIIKSINRRVNPTNRSLLENSHFSPLGNNVATTGKNYNKMLNELNTATNLLNLAIEDAMDTPEFIDLCKKTLKEIELLSLDLSLRNEWNEVFFGAARIIAIISLNILAQDQFQTDTDLFSAITTTAHKNLYCPIATASNECSAMINQLNQTKDQLAEVNQKLLSTETMTTSDQSTIDRLFQKIDTLSLVLKKHINILASHPKYNAQIAALEEYELQQTNRIKEAIRIYNQHEDKQNLQKFILSILIISWFRY